MKKAYVQMLMLALFFCASSQVFAQKPEPKLVFASSDSEQVLSYSVAVMSIIDAKCFGCHQPGGRSEEAKKALTWEKLQSMEKADVVAVLDEIIEVLEKGEMPPKKMVEKYPGMKMSDEEVKTLKDWADATLNSLTNE